LDAPAIVPSISTIRSLISAELDDDMVAVV
jgi:hypothetical protein